MATWADIFKMFNYAFSRNPIEKRGEKYFSGAGVRQPEAIPDIRSDGSYWGGGRGVIRLRDTNDFLDLSTVVNRQARYKEYERLRNVPEIEMVMNIYADEACMSGDTIIPTPLYGEKKLKWLAENVHERFLVYAFDFDKNDYTLAWAFNPRLTKEEETIRILLDDGSSFCCTRDHRILLKSGMFCFAEDLKEDDELMPFYRLPAKTELTNIKTNQFPRIYTHSKGWIHERQFIDEWRGKKNPKLETVNQVMRMACAGVSTRECEKLVGYDRKSLRNWLKKEGFTHKELKWLSKKEDRRIVVGVMPHKKMPVYDLSVEKHQNYCTTWGVVHNCQKGENGQVFEIICKNSDIKKELENLFFSRKKLNMNQRKLWNITKETCIAGDWFGEVIVDPDNPKKGILDIMPLPPESIYRIETTKGKLIEFQQGKEGPDYQSLSRVEVTKATEAELQQATAIRFTPEQVIHLRIGEDRKTFYPYGVSLIEPARGPAHQLRLAEDAMIVYRLSRAPERRVFYIDVGNIPSHKHESFIERMKDQLRKKKVVRSTQEVGASGVDERWAPPSADEDYFIPVRPNSNTRIETLPGAENLGEIDDVVYFRNKVFVALNFPVNYVNETDSSQTRISLSYRDQRFARMIERLQSYVEEDLLYNLADIHLRLKGYPEELYEDLVVKMTPPSEWRDLSRSEIINARIGYVTSLKGSQVMSDFDLLVKFMKYTEDEAQEIVARNELQKLKDIKMQIIAQNPQLTGLGIPGNEGENEIGIDAAGPNPMLGDEPQNSISQQQNVPEGPPQQQNQNQPQNPQEQDAPTEITFGEPSYEDIKKYDLDIEDYAQEMDQEDIDYSEQ